MSSGSGSGLTFSLSGFPVAIPLNTLLGVALIAWLWLPSFASVSSTQTQQWASAIIFAVALLASVLIHELAHAWVARRFGFPVEGITLWAFGGFTSYRPVRNTPAREAAVAISGPASTLVLAGAAWLLLRAVPDGPPMLMDIIGAIALANLFVGIFNLLPGLPLDGGSVLSAGIWQVTRSRVKGQRYAAYCGMGLAALVVAVPLWSAWRSNGNADLSFVVISALLAAFLFVGARGALAGADAEDALDGRTAIDLAVPVVIVPSSATVATLDEYLASTPHSATMVALVGEPATGIVGYVLPPAMQSVPVPVRSSTSIGSVVRTMPQWAWVRADTDAADAARALRDAGSPVLVLDAANRPVGVLMARQG
jgi:Zn-dependent protease